MKTLIRSVATAVAHQVAGGADMDEAIREWDGENVIHGDDSSCAQYLTVYHDTPHFHAAVRDEANRQMKTGEYIYL